MWKEHIFYTESYVFVKFLNNKTEVSQKFFMVMDILHVSNCLKFELRR